MEENKRALPKGYMRVEIEEGSVSEKDRTFDVVFSKGSVVLRRPFFEDDFEEELSLDSKHIDLKRLNSGNSPVLDTHMSFHGTDDVIGVVMSAETNGKKGTAKIRFADDEKSLRVFQKVKDKILRNISIGYLVRKFKDITKEGAKIKRFLAVDWQPFEISVVPVGADPGAVIRKEEKEIVYEYDVISERKNMDNEKPVVDVVEPTPAAPPTEPQKPVETFDSKAIRAEAAKDERKRISEITDMCRKFKMTKEFTASLCEKEVSLLESRKLVMDSWIEADKTKDINTTVAAPKGTDTRKEKREAIENAILHKYDPDKYELTDHGREYRGMTIMDIGRTFLGNTKGMSKLEIAGSMMKRQGLHTTDDFPLLIENVLNKTLRDAYLESPKTWEFFTKTRSVSDFKEISNVQFGESPTLELVLEAGEFSKSTIEEGAEKYRVLTYGRIFALSRQLLINDDLNAFMTRISVGFGRQAANRESDLVWNLIIDNDKLQTDDIELFDTPVHKNLTAAGGVISVDALGEGRRSVRVQKGLDTKTHLGLRVSWLVVPAQLETEGDKFIARNVPDPVTNVNPFGTNFKLQLAVEPRLDDDSLTAWYLFSDKGQVDMVEMALLDGKRGPTIETDLGFEIDGMQIKARMDVGVKALDFRGFYKNPGV